MAKKKHTKKAEDTVTVNQHAPIKELLRVKPGPVNLADYDSSATTGFPGKGKKDAPELTAALLPVLADLQERLYANGRDDAQARRVLLILQGMDTSGKGGIISHVIGMVDPQGVSITSFKVPTAEERKHDFLWRIDKAKPGPGMIGIFDRSQYEDVLVARVNNIVPEDVWSKRYDEINAWEAGLTRDDNTTIIKCFLHVGKDKQKERLAARLEDPTKYWKYNPGDLDTRSHWDAYVEAYEDALTLCNTDDAPWFIVPADRKWYRNWAIAEILTQTLAELGQDWPPADFDVAAEQARVAAC